MNIYDAAKILSISGAITPEITKAAYHAACKKYHPDINPAGEDMMKIVNQAFDALKDHQGDIEEEQPEYGDLLNDALNAVLGLSGVLCEICGSWLWITGNLKAYEVGVVRYREEKERKEYLNIIAQSIAQVSGGRLAEHGRGIKSDYFDHGIAELWHDQKITLQLNDVTPAQAIQIISMLKTENSE